MIRRDLMVWCPGRESNPYGPLEPADFKSAASTNFTTRAGAALSRQRSLKTKEEARGFLFVCSIWSG